MNEIHADLLRCQIAKDVKWCVICALHSISRRAVVSYTVATDAMSSTVPCCRECFEREIKRNKHIVSSEPVAQPEYIAVLEAALA